MRTQLCMNTYKGEKDRKRERERERKTVSVSWVCVRAV